MDPSELAAGTATTKKPAQPPATVIALLDDDIRFIRMVERVLRDEGVGIIPVTTPDLDEAVAVIESQRCDLAMVDVFMYDNAAGFEVVERLRSHAATAHLPLLVTSGAHREVARRVEFLREHRCGLLLKPFTPDDLVSTIREYLAGPKETLAVSASHTTIGASAPALSPRFARPSGAYAPSRD